MYQVIPQLVNHSKSYDVNENKIFTAYFVVSSYQAFFIWYRKWVLSSPKGRMSSGQDLNVHTTSAGRPFVHDYASGKSLNRLPVELV